MNRMFTREIVPPEPHSKGPDTWAYLPRWLRFVLVLICIAVTLILILVKYVQSVTLVGFCSFGGGHVTRLRESPAQAGRRGRGKPRPYDLALPALRV
jgi:hypothetical protein